jgi:hypothetical protein
MRALSLVLVLVALSTVSRWSVAASAAQDGRMTIFARPEVLGWAQGTVLFGVARGAGFDDIVEVEIRECGSAVFRTFAEAHANAGGGWEMPAGTLVTSSFRARWRQQISPVVTVRQRAQVSLERRRSGRGFVVTAIAKRSLWRKRVEIQRRERAGWRTMLTRRLTDSVKSTGTVSASQTTLRLVVPRGTQLRAVLPAAQAAPCYIRSVSRVVRT